jgi:hypothetical protein
MDEKQPSSVSAGEGCFTIRAGIERFVIFPSASPRKPMSSRIARTKCRLRSRAQSRHQKRKSSVAVRISKTVRDRGFHALVEVGSARSLALIDHSTLGVRKKTLTFMKKVPM